MLVQTASTGLCLSYKIYAVLSLLSAEDAKVEIPEKYKIYTQAHYDLRANGFTISVRPINTHLHPSYVLHVRCVDDELKKSYKITWWIADCGDTEHGSVRCCPTTQNKEIVFEEGAPVRQISDYHMFDEDEHPSQLSYEEILVAVAVIRNKLYRGAQKLDAIYGVHHVMNE
jgi:hypothetical protein